MSPKDETCAVNIPAFLSKLWKIVNDPEIDNIVCWSADGRSFVIQDQAQFWYNILPIYYKHNNMSSFVRQLNMYGFHKIHADDKGKDHDELKFYHPFFRRSEPSLMKNIKRKMIASHRTPVKAELAEATTADTQVTNLNHMTKVLVDVKQLQTRQESVDNQLASMKKENAALWRELALLRQKHMKQQQLVNKLIHFLVHIVNPSRSNMGGMGRKRKFPLMINDIAGSSKSQKTGGGGSSSSEDGLIIHEVDSEDLLSNEDVEEVNAAEPSEEEMEEALIDSPENLMMDSTDEFLDIPMTDEVVDSPDSLCPDNILAEDPNIEIVDQEQQQPEQLGEQQEEEGDQRPSFIDISDLGLIDEAKKPDTTTLYPNLSSAAPIEEPTTITPAVTAKKKETSGGKPSINKLQVATRSTNSLPISISIPNAQMEPSKAITLNSPDDFENHLEATQEELDSIKELLLDGYALDPNTVLNLNSTIFTDMPLQLFMTDDNLPMPQQDPMPSTSAAAIKYSPAPGKDSAVPNEEDVDFSCDPMVSGSSIGNELMPYTSANIAQQQQQQQMQENLLDFENLFENDTSPENTMDPSMELMNLVNMAESDSSTLNTPVQIKTEPPSFPVPSPSNNKNANTNGKKRTSK